MPLVDAVRKKLQGPFIESTGSEKDASSLRVLSLLSFPFLPLAPCHVHQI